MSDPEEAALVRRIAEGDSAAFAAFYRKYERKLFGFIKKRLNDPFEAADILHVVFMEVWQKAGTFEGRSRVSTWLFGIAFNKTMDRMRRTVPQPMSDDESGIRDLADEAPAALDLVLVREEAVHVRHCLARLKEAHRVVMELAFFEDMSYGDIATVTGTPEGTIKTRAFYARKALRSCLERRLGATP